MSFSICTSIRQLLEYFILSSDMQDTAPPSSSFTIFYPISRPLWPLDSTYSKRHVAGSTTLCFLCQTQPQQQLPSTVITFSFWIFHTCKKQSPAPRPSPSNQWDWRESWNCSWGRGEQSRTYSQGSITVLVKGSNWFFCKYYCSHGLQIDRPCVLLILFDIKWNMTILIYKASPLTDLSAFIHGQN